MKPYFARYLIHGTDTGRISGDFMQVPRVVPDLPNLRNCVAAPDGLYLLEADMSMIELRLIAWRAQEETMLRLLRGGADIHVRTGAEAILAGGTEQANLLLMRLGLPANRAAAKVLQAVFEEAACSSGLDVSGSEWAYQAAWSWLRKCSRSGADASFLQNWHRNIHALSEDCLREMWQHILALRSSQGSQPEEQQTLEFRDAVQILSSKGASGFLKLSPILSFARQVGKTVNFSLGYEAGPPKLAEIMLLTMKDEDIARVTQLLRVPSLAEAAVAIHRRWHEMYPGVRRWHTEEKRRILVNKGIAVAPQGREKRVPMIFSQDPKERADGFREGINHVIQSPATDLLHLSAIIANKAMYGAYGVVAGPWPFHDAVLYLMRPDRVGEAVIYLRDVMLRQAVAEFKAAFGVDIDVPLEVDFKGGVRWGALEKIEARN